MKRLIYTAAAVLLLLAGCDLYPWYEDEGDETDNMTGEVDAWCFTNPDGGGPMRNWCYPLEHGNPGIGYMETSCAAHFDFDAWNYDGTCQPGNCNEVVTTARLCFDADHVDQVSEKPPGDTSVRTCREDPFANGDNYPSLYLTGEYSDSKMHDPLCAPQELVSEIGPMCLTGMGVVCLSHNLFCACRCETDDDCESPSVCEGYTPGALWPSFCEMPFG